VTNFGANPSSLRMFVYVPAAVTPHPAIVVAVHYCHGDGPAFFNGSHRSRPGPRRARQPARPVAPVAAPPLTPSAVPGRAGSWRR
jgi:hypothetical protein